MLKRYYTAHSPFIRAALDYLGVNHTEYQNFGSFAEMLANVRRREGCKEEAEAMFAQGLVERAWLHTNQRLGNETRHVFHVRFKKRDSGLCPYLWVYIEKHQEDEWKKKAASYRKTLSLKSGIRRTSKSGKKPPL